MVGTNTGSTAVTPWQWSLHPAPDGIVLRLSGPWRMQDRLPTSADGPAGGDLAFEARWRILDAAGKEIALKTTRLAEPTGGPGYSATVSAMSRALAALSRDVAQALAALPK